MYVVASGGPEVYSTVHPDAETDVSPVEFGSKEVYDILKAKGLTYTAALLKLHTHNSTDLHSLLQIRM